MTIDLARTLSSVIVLAMIFGLACGGGPKFNESTVYIDVQKIPLDMRDEYASFASNCSKCHSLSRALNAPVTDPKHWDLYVARMMRTAGSAISPHESPVILRFLHWYTLSYETASAMPGEQAPSDTPDVVLPPQPFPAASQASPVDPPPPVQDPVTPQDRAAATDTPPTPEQTPDATDTTGEGK